MAILYPELHKILNLKVPPTRGELSLLKFLNDLLDESYEIFFQPYIDADNPDIIVMKENVGVWIIEVKDWNLSSYIIEENKWYLRKNGNKIRSPIKQVEQYKDNFFRIHSDLLNKKYNKDFRTGLLIKTSVYFHNATQEEINSMIDERHRKYTDCIGHNGLTFENIKILMNKKYLDRISIFFDFEVYQEFKTILSPSEQQKEINDIPQLSKKQLEISISETGIQKVLGPAGSGKTLVLAKRAVNSVLRTGEKTLILTYNITLKNYISDQISKFRGDILKSSFEISNYHRFIVAQLNNFNIDYNEAINFEDEELFESVAGDINKYSSIFCDEIQDFTIEWQRILKKYFLKDDGEFVVFGDEKQNIYNRSLENKKIKTLVSGAWNKLEKSYRLPAQILDLSIKFQQKYMNTKYELDNEAIQLNLDNINNNNSSILYFFSNTNELQLKNIETVFSAIKALKIHSNDICILGTSSINAYKFDLFVRHRLKRKTNTVFEHNENDDKFIILDEFSPTIDYSFSKFKKSHFWMNSGTLKIASIHSFKGWEISSLILVISDVLDNSNDEKVTNKIELLYTAMTRCKKNLIIINLGDNILNNFFTENRHIINENIEL
jgi:hypothetical protein